MRWLLVLPAVYVVWTLCIILWARRDPQFREELDWQEARDLPPLTPSPWNP